MLSFKWSLRGLEKQIEDYSEKFIDNVVRLEPRSILFTRVDPDIVGERNIMSDLSQRRKQAKRMLHSNGGRKVLAAYICPGRSWAVISYIRQ